MKRILAAAAVVALAGCGTAVAANGPDALDLALRIPNAEQANMDACVLSIPVSMSASRAQVDVFGDQDVVATFSTKSDRMVWARTLASQCGGRFNSNRVDNVDGNVIWTMVTTDHAGYKLDAPQAPAITHALTKLHGRIVPIGSK